MIIITLKGGKRTTAYLKGIEKRLPRMSKAAIKDYSKMLIKKMGSIVSQDTRFHEQSTGELANSFFIRATNDGYNIHSRARHAMMVVRGTRPHVIVPVRASMLSWERWGARHFRKIVHHPGSVGTRYDERAIEQTRNALKVLVEKYMGKAFRGR